MTDFDSDDDVWDCVGNVRVRRMCDGAARCRDDVSACRAPPPGSSACQPWLAGAARAQTTLGPDAAVARLMAGNARYVAAT